MGIDCYLALKKEDLADIEFVELDRLYYFEAEFPEPVLYPVMEFYRRCYRLLASPFPQGDKSRQTYWLNTALSTANPQRCNYAGIISEFKYQDYHDYQCELKIETIE